MLRALPAWRMEWPGAPRVIVLTGSPADKDRGVSSESRDNAKAKFPKQYREDPETKKDLENLHQQVTGKKKSPLTDKAVSGLLDAMGPHKPDFSGQELRRHRSG